MTGEEVMVPFIEELNVNRSLLRQFNAKIIELDALYHPLVQSVFNDLICLLKTSFQEDRYNLVHKTKPPSICVNNKGTLCFSEAFLRWDIVRNYYGSVELIFCIYIFFDTKTQTFNVRIWARSFFDEGKDLPTSFSTIIPVPNYASMEQLMGEVLKELFGPGLVVLESKGLLK